MGELGVHHGVRAQIQVARQHFQVLGAGMDDFRARGVQQQRLQGGEGRRRGGVDQRHARIAGELVEGGDRMERADAQELGVHAHLVAQRIHAGGDGLVAGKQIGFANGAIPHGAGIGDGWRIGVVSQRRGDLAGRGRWCRRRCTRVHRQAVRRGRCA